MPFNVNITIMPKVIKAAYLETVAWCKRKVKPITDCLPTVKSPYSSVGEAVADIRDRSVTARNFCQNFYANLAQTVRDHPVGCFLGMFILPVSAPIIIGLSARKAYQQAKQRDSGGIATPENKKGFEPQTGDKVLAPSKNRQEKFPVEQAPKSFKSVDEVHAERGITLDTSSQSTQPEDEKGR